MEWQDTSSEGEEGEEGEYYDEDLDIQDEEMSAERTQTENDSGSPNLLGYKDDIMHMEELGLTDIGRLAHWKVSSHKIGHGVAALQEDNIEKFWQSDGPLPHHLDIQFAKRVSINRINVYTDFLTDESYTPSKIVVSSGTGYQDLQEVATIELNEPRGWIYILLDSFRKDGVLKSFLIRLSILTNHQNGKDTHLRAVKIYSPGNSTSVQDREIGFTSIALLSETVIR